MEVTIIRHTRVDVPSGTCYGQKDVALAPTFETEAKAYMEQLNQPFDAIYSSPASRCIQLAYKFHPNPTKDQRLLEMNFGEWEGLNWNAIPPDISMPWMEDFVHIAPPNGENLQMMYNRIAQFLNELKQQSHDKVLIVAHAGVMRCIWAYITQIPLANIFKIPIGYGEILRINLAIDSSHTMIIQKQ